jgi:sulfonate transport system permease protein
MNAQATQLALGSPTLSPVRTWIVPRWIGQSFAVTARTLFLPLLILGLWQLTSWRGWIAPQILPAPTIVWATFVELIRSGDTPTNLLISLERVGWGFLAGGSIGLVFGILMAQFPSFRAYVYPSFTIFTQVPALGWIPLLMMFVGIGEALKIIIIAKAAMVPVAINTFQGIRNIPENHFEVASVFRLTRLQVVHKVILPAALPSIFTGLRYGLTHAWLALVTVELLASSEGIGFQMVWGRQLFQLDVVIASILVIGIVGLSIDLVFSLIESRLLRWRRAAF